MTRGDVKRGIVPWGRRTEEGSGYSGQVTPETQPIVDLSSAIAKRADRVTFVTPETSFTNGLSLLRRKNPHSLDSLEQRFADVSLSYRESLDSQPRLILGLWPGGKEIIGLIASGRSISAGMIVEGVPNDLFREIIDLKDVLRDKPREFLSSIIDYGFANNDQRPAIEKLFSQTQGDSSSQRYPHLRGVAVHLIGSLNQ